jgi:microcystin-dependent protein
MKRLIMVVIPNLIFCFFLLPAQARADSPIPGEVRIWTGTEPPTGWFFCDGRQLAIASYPELYAVFERDYDLSVPSGYFSIPDLRGRVVVMRDTSQAEFLVHGQEGGEITHTLTIAEMPIHTHSYDRPDTGTPAYGIVASGTGANLKRVTNTSGSAGGGGGHNNLQPYIVLMYIIYAGGASAPTSTPTATPTSTPTSTVTPTPTSTITPTATTTTTSTYLPAISAYTTTLRSGKTLTVPVSVNLGQYIFGGVLMSLIAVFAMSFLYKLVYRR